MKKTRGQERLEKFHDIIDFNSTKENVDENHANLTAEIALKFASWSLQNKQNFMIYKDLEDAFDYFIRNVYE